MRICVTGGAGYVGSKLVPSLLSKGHDVTVLDTFWFGDHLGEHDSLVKLQGDIRDPGSLDIAFSEQDAVIHLACVSNDPSFDMNPGLGRAINYGCFQNILFWLKEHKVARFIYASSSSVYGVSDLDRVIETSPKNPITDYSKFKLQCELELQTIGTNGCWTIVRPATVCGYAPRLRLDLVVNILTAQALANGKMTIHGGPQMRPNININDMVRAYEHILDMPMGRVNEKVFNVGFENKSLLEIGEAVRLIAGGEMIVQDVIDQRSYRVDSKKIKDELGFEPTSSIEDAITGLAAAHYCGVLTDPLNNPDYYNIKKMKELCL